MGPQIDMHRGGVRVDGVGDMGVDRVEDIVVIVLPVLHRRFNIL